VNIKNIVEKPKKEEAPSNLVNTGIYIFNKDIFDKIKKTEISERGEYEITDSLSMQIADGKNVIGHKTSKDWIDVGRPWELIEVNEELIGQLKTEIRGKIEGGAIFTVKSFWMKEALSGQEYTSKAMSI
jgi:bifunctional UDP-N-acetylglucosamine pyrophosphorylase/glucosamine-1-phosphate N-acetyltransferase